MEEIQNTLADFRRLRGFSAIRLATTVGVRRQTIYAIEAGTYVPNAVLALRLAKALETTVEELFTLDADDANVKGRIEEAEMLPASGKTMGGAAVQLCQVGDRLMAFAPAAASWCLPLLDATVSSTGRKAVQVAILDHESKFDDRILVAGCDPGISVLARHAQAAGVKLVLAHRNSRQALSLLKTRCIHIAGTHLKDGSGESNLPQVTRLFARERPAVIAFASWQQGILTARGNPKRIGGIADFARGDVQITNRENGAGSRLLLDTELKRLGIKPQAVHGYRQMAEGHLAAAWQVHSGFADACLATGGAARLFGLHFIPLSTERYDFAIGQEHLHTRGVQKLLNVLSQRCLRRELDALGGYDTQVTGQRLL